MGAGMKKRIIAVVILGVLLLTVVLAWRAIAFQVLLTASSLKHSEARDRARDFCGRIVTNDAPTAEWLASVDDRDKIGDKTNYFYFLKVHFIECQTQPSHVRHGRILVFQDTPTNAIGHFYYQHYAPCLQMTFLKETPGDWRVRAIFPLNNCLFDPDVNRDGKVDRIDVEAAKTLNK